MRAYPSALYACRLVWAAGLAGLMAFSSQALAQGSSAANWPERTIKLIVPSPPGGINDAVARPVADKLKDLLGTVVIENRGGAGGTIGATAAARSDPDGYTILFGSGATHIVGPAITPTKTYDPVKDFKAVAILTVSGLGIAVHPGLGVHTLQELIAHARQNPGKLSYGSAGVGSATHLGAELFKSLINDPSIVHVPYKGGGPAIGDLVSGQIRLAVLNISGSMIELHNAGKLRILAVTSQQRVKSAPQIPTAIEAGVSDLFAINFSGLFVPAATPAPIMARISQAATQMMSDAKLVKLFEDAGLQIAAQTTPETAQVFVNDEIARWTPVIKRIGLAPKQAPAKKSQ